MENENKDKAWLTKAIIDRIKNRNLIKKQREIEERKLDIELAKLDKELKEIKG